MISLSKEELEKLIDDRVTTILNKRLTIELNTKTGYDYYSPGHVDISVKVKLILDGVEISTSSDSTSFSIIY